MYVAKHGALPGRCYQLNQNPNESFTATWHNCKQMEHCTLFTGLWYPRVFTSHEPRHRQHRELCRVLYGVVLKSYTVHILDGGTLLQRNSCKWAFPFVMKSHRHMDVVRSTYTPSNHPISWWVTRCVYRTAVWYCSQCWPLLNCTLAWLHITNKHEHCTLLHCFVRFRLYPKSECTTVNLLRNI